MHGSVQVWLNIVTRNQSPSSPQVKCDHPESGSRRRFHHSPHKTSQFLTLHDLSNYDLTRHLCLWPSHLCLWLVPVNQIYQGQTYPAWCSGSVRVDTLRYQQLMHHGGGKSLPGINFTLYVAHCPQITVALVVLALSVSNVKLILCRVGQV
jgi:hypothetical protein